MKAAKDSNQPDVSFKEGDLVYLKLRPYRMRALSKRFNEKLSPKYFGPFAIIKQVNVVTYKLALPANCRIHPVFHASQLKKVVGNPDHVLPLPST